MPFPSFPLKNMSDERRGSLVSITDETAKLLPKELEDQEGEIGVDLTELGQLGRDQQVAFGEVENSNEEDMDVEDQDEGDGMPTPTSSRVFMVIGILLLSSFLLCLMVLDVGDLLRSHSPAGNGKAPKLILISLDGTRPEYLDRGLTPNLSKLASGGVFHRIVPSFPSVTFPNHYSLVTGLYPESHGIVGNSFYDPSLNETFHYSSPVNNGESKWWSQAEPIWITARRQGLISATCFWPGSEAEHGGLRPNYWKQFQFVGIEQELQWILEWIDQPAQLAPDIVTLYIPHIDAAGHSFGPDSKEVNDTLVMVDSRIGDLVSALQSRNLYEATNFIVVSDHGMALTDPASKVIFLDDYFDTSLLHNDHGIIYNGPLVSLSPIKDSDVDKILSKLEKAATTQGHFKVWKHDSIPRKYHYNSARVGDIILLADLNWMFVTSSKNYNSSSPPFPKGVHGWDIHSPDMFAIFVGHGPYFNASSKEEMVPDDGIHTVSNIEVYPLLANILNIIPAPHNGTGILIPHK